MTIISKRSRRVFAAMALFAIAATIGGTIGVKPAHALPAFARQTGNVCADCHIAFPELTPYGRRFKLGGYTMTGGQTDLPQLAAMLQAGFTHTDKDQEEDAAPHFDTNNNTAVQEASLFYAGKVYDGLGAFAQATYSSAEDRFGWDNVDLRYAKTLNLDDGNPLILGVTANNSPTVQDVWNTTPVWGFPYFQSALAPTPAAVTLIEDGLGQKVGGLGGYAFWNDMLYAELSGYASLSAQTQTVLGTDPSGRSINGVAPYWRLALEPTFGPHNIEVGTFGLSADMFPEGERHGATDHFTDIGLDTQYQYNAGNHDVTLQLSWIHEIQSLDASQALGLTANSDAILNSLHAKVSYFYNHTYGGSFGVFSTSGSEDSVAFAPDPVGGSANGKPNSSGLVAELDYLPFSNGGPDFWPWLNAKVALQFIAYDKFNGGRDNYDGSGRNASDNNTLFLSTWLAF